MTRPTTTMTVSRTERLGAHLVRVHLGDPGFDGFVGVDHTDAYVKLHLDDPRSPGQQVLRTYTVRSVDPVAREIAIDFVVHGDIGVAGPWAAAVRAGTPVTFYGPSGGYSPDPDADWHLLAGDESALPAIGATLEKLHPAAVGQAFVEVAGPEGEIELSAPAGVSITWVHRGAPSNEVGDHLTGDRAPLVAAVRSAPWLPGRVQVFIHGEARAVMQNLRRYVRGERGVPASDASISGYWRRGRTEEGFREWKREYAAAQA